MISEELQERINWAGTCYTAEYKRLITHLDYFIKDEDRRHTIINIIKQLEKASYNYTVLLNEKQIQED